MISAFSADEVRAWVDLGESESFPSLYLFRLEGNQVIFHMEKLENGEIAVEFSSSVSAQRKKDHPNERPPSGDHPGKRPHSKDHPDETPPSKDHPDERPLWKDHPD